MREGTRNGAAGRALAGGKPADGTEPRCTEAGRAAARAEGLPSPAPRARSPGDAACGLGAPALWSARAAAAESGDWQVLGSREGRQFPRRDQDLAGAASSEGPVWMERRPHAHTGPLDARPAPRCPGNGSATPRTRSHRDRALGDGRGGACADWRVAMVAGGARGWRVTARGGGRAPW